MLRALLNLLKRIWLWLTGRDFDTSAPPPTPPVAPPIPTPAYRTPPVSPPAPGSPSSGPQPTPPTPPPSAIATPVPGEPELGLGSGEPPVYRRKSRFMSFQERRFYRTLQQEVGQEYEVLAKVRIGDVIELANEPYDRRRYTSILWAKHFDFLICDRYSLIPLLAIELDDSSHTRYDRQQSDAVKTWLCEQADLPLMRIEVRKNYGQGAIGRAVRQRLQTSENTADPMT